MKKRVIGGTLYFLIFVAALMTKFHLILFPLFLIIGLGEIYRLQKQIKNKNYVIFYSLIFITGMLFLTYFAATNNTLTFLVALIIMLNDTMALLFGKLWGKHQLSSISPNKTVEGSIGGIIGGSISALLISYYGSMLANFIGLSQIGDLLSGTKIFGDNILLMIVFAMIITMLGQVGDLLESKLKRMAKQKDSGKIIYGHGGILDRVDSLLLAMIFVAIITI